MDVIHPKGSLASRRQLASLAIATLALSGCVDGKKIADAVEPLCRLGPPAYLPAMDLPQLSSSPKAMPEEAFLLEVHQGEIRLESDPISVSGEQGRMDAASKFAELARRMQEPKQTITAVTVAAEPSTPTTLLLELLRAAHGAGITTVFAVGDSAQPPPAPDVPQPELYQTLEQATSPAERQERVAAAIQDGIWYCSDLTSVIRAIASSDPARKCEYAAMGLRELRGPCLGSQDTLETAFVLAFWHWRPLTHHRLTIEPEGTAPAASSWGELLKTKPTRLAL
jgi:hypothetical protein